MTSCAAPLADCARSSEQSSAERRRAVQSARQKARHDLSVYHAYTNGWSVPRHQHLMCEAMEWVERTPNARLVMVLPPRHGKTEVEVSAIGWALARGQYGLGPIQRVCLAMYGEKLAASYTAQARDHFVGAGYGARAFPGLALAGTAEAEWRFADVPPGRPSCIAVGVGGPFTGRGVDWLFIDDPIKTAEEALSAHHREKNFRWWQGVARDRLQPGGRVVVTLTRWHDDDLVGRLLEHDTGKWRVLHLPAINEDGEALWPEQYPVEALRDIRDGADGIGPSWFEAKFQGNPVPEKGSIWQRQWFDDVRYNPADRLPYLDPIITYWDTAFCTGEENDYSAWCRMGFCPQDGTYWVLNMGRKRMEFNDLERAIAAGCGGAPHEEAVIERKASGISAIQTLKRNCRRPVRDIKADHDKAVRARTVSGLAEAGKVRLPLGVPAVEEALAEIIRFPAAPHDDRHDAFVHGLRDMRDRMQRAQFVELDYAQAME